MSNSFQLLVGADAFVREFTTSLKNCRESLYVQFSPLKAMPVANASLALMMESARAGVDVRLIVDCYSDVVISDTYLFSLHRRGELLAERAATIPSMTRCAIAGSKSYARHRLGFWGCICSIAITKKW